MGIIGIGSGKASAVADGNVDCDDRGFVLAALGSVSMTSFSTSCSNL